jgi:hypothetical protein
MESGSGLPYSTLTGSTVEIETYLKQITNFLDIYVKLGGWVAKLVARPLAPAAFCVLIWTSLKNHKWATLAKGVAYTLWPSNKYTKNIYVKLRKKDRYGTVGDFSNEKQDV